MNRNFGCGSSREHAPQGLARAGIRAIVGESFSEIFQGNAAMLGLPCFTADRASIEALQALVERSPETTITARVDTATLTAGDLRLRIDAAARAARGVPERPVESDGDAPRSVRRGAGRGGAAAGFRLAAVKAGPEGPALRISRGQHPRAHSAACATRFVARPFQDRGPRGVRSPA